MTHQDQGALKKQLENLDADSTSRFLRLSLTGPRRPVDDLLDYLDDHPGPEGFESLLQRGPASSCGPPAKTLLRGAATLEQLIAIKERSKEKVSRPASMEERLAGLVGYFSSVAAAIVHHRKRICGRSLRDLSPILLDLASALEGEWSEFLAGAARGGD